MNYFLGVKKIANVVPIRGAEIATEEQTVVNSSRSNAVKKKICHHGCFSDGPKQSGMREDYEIPRIFLE